MNMQESNGHIYSSVCALNVKASNLGVPEQIQPIGNYSQLSSRGLQYARVYSNPSGLFAGNLKAGI